MDNYLIIAAVGFIILILLVYSYVKDAEINKKFFLYEKAIEDLNKKIYELEKKRKLKDDKDDKIDELKEYIDEIIEANLKKLSEFAISLKKEQKEQIELLRDEIFKKISHMDEKIKNFSILPDSFESNEKKIISLYKKGLSVSEIARDLRVGIGEVELVLKIEGLK